MTELSDNAPDKIKKAMKEWDDILEDSAKDLLELKKDLHEYGESIEKYRQMVIDAQLKYITMGLKKGKTTEELAKELGAKSTIELLCEMR